MDNPNFTTTLQIKTDRAQAFNALTQNIQSWWGKVDNKAAGNIGDEFSVFFENSTEWRFKIIEIEDLRKVSWKCIYAKHIIPGREEIESEWLDTVIRFTLHDAEENTIKLEFEHDGLQPNLNCYDICTTGWNYFIVNSLKLFLENGQGRPNLV